jgi:hypothetical protein
VNRDLFRVLSTNSKKAFWADLILDFGLWRSYSAVTVSPSGPRKLFKGVTTATSGVLTRFPLLLPVRNSFASYGASAVTRTSGRGHVAEA